MRHWRICAHSAGIRALVAIAESRSPDAAMGAGTSAPVRMQLLAAGPRPELAVIAYGIALVALLTPLALLSLVLG